MWQSPETDGNRLRNPPYIRVYVADAHIPSLSVPGGESVLDRIRKLAITDEVMKVDVDMGFSPPPAFSTNSESALWPGIEYTWFEPDLPLEGVMGVLKGIRIFHPV
ncbi:hypothetical protein BDV98DRAFT_570260 [Pterulicium gracile]|uniref:Uncharacterized protein n=1 Tax=Pterulicium gracile TaxID=1884261 RepID=A0A5C3QF51_9AGAR|nr:hypothetical protein BDV98DRAFT_570260 [Pterula gracilis]